MSWYIQNLSNRNLNMSTVSTSTTVLGKLTYLFSLKLVECLVAVGMSAYFTSNDLSSPTAAVSLQTTAFHRDSAAQDDERHATICHSRCLA